MEGGREEREVGEREKRERREGEREIFTVAWGETTMLIRKVLAS